jgi:hypothetical protein
MEDLGGLVGGDGTWEYQIPSYPDLGTVRGLRGGKG